VAARCGGLTRVNVYKDRIKLAKPGALPPLPHAPALTAALAPVRVRRTTHVRARSATRCPVFRQILCSRAHCELAAADQPPGESNRPVMRA